MIKLTNVGEDCLFSWLNEFGFLADRQHEHRTRVNEVDTVIFDNSNTVSIYAVLTVTHPHTQTAIVGNKEEIIEFVKNGGGKEMFLLPDAVEFIMAYFGYVRDPETKYWVTKKFLGIK